MTTKGHTELVAANPDAPLAIGERAPDFLLRRTFEESVELRTLLANGAVLLAFYVFDFGHV